jgi:hypothetical protein
MLRKQILHTGSVKPAYHDGISIQDVATVFVTSEAVDHPVDHICDGHHGRGATRWIAGEPGEQVIVLAFDSPQDLHKVSLEIEEPNVSRTQELTLALSFDGGQTYREVLRQEYNFSPPGTTFERETWVVPARAVTHLRLCIKPDKSNHPAYATITSLVLQ